jgi:cell division protein FtsB
VRVFLSFLVLIAALCPLAVPQTHMTTRHGDVARMQPQEQLGPTPPPPVKLDPAQLQREAQELLELSQSLQADIDSLNHNQMPKDMIEKLKRIQKLAKHLRGELEP